MQGLKIEYTIDNFSELIDVSDYKHLSPKSKNIGIYFLYNENKELIYIGKSSCCIRGRLCNHLITETPRPYDDFWNNLILNRRKDIKYFAYSIIEKENVEMVEAFLIRKFKPKYNLEFNN